MAAFYRDRSGKIFEPRANDIVRPRQGVFAILVVGGKILLSWPSHDLHRGELPGGGIEADESEDQALIREMYEETGIHFTSLQIERSYRQDILFYAEDHKEYWAYDQRYKILNPEGYEGFVFDGRRPMPENGFASWEKLEDLNKDNMQIFHFEALQKLNVI